MCDVNAVAAAYQPFEDGIRRWRDLDIARWLGQENPRTIRTVIEANRSELERHGSLMALPSNPGRQGGRPGIEYWLTFEQAMVICTQSRTARAEDVRTVMIQVFTAHVQGAAVMPRLELRALDIAAEQIIRPLKVRMDRIELRQEHTELTVAQFRRKPLSKATRQTHYQVILLYYNGLCPCCGDCRIIIGGQFVAENEEHWYGRHKNGVFQTWITCGYCNNKLESDSSFKRTHASEFETYQKRVYAYTDKQGRLFA
jgi:hypothetical protein